MQTIHFEMIIPDTVAGLRLDQALSQLLPDYSRSKITEWIREKKISVDGKFPAPKEKVFGGEKIIGDATLDQQTHWEKQALPLEIVYEDADLIVVNKPIGLVVHPAAGNPDQTLVNALLHHHPALEQLPRAGIIHRLDKDTSGLLVTAKTLGAHTHLVNAMQAREITREYYAIVAGVMTGGGTVDAPVGRHPKSRTKMAITSSGKPAITHYRVIERFRAHTWIKCQLDTGRTHQIRVHMAHIHHPLVGDQTYGGRFKIPAGISTELLEALKTFHHQALHAFHLVFQHPREDRLIDLTIELPEDMKQLIAAMKQDAIHD